MHQTSPKVDPQLSKLRHVVTTNSFLGFPTQTFSFPPTEKRPVLQNPNPHSSLTSTTILRGGFWTWTWRRKWNLLSVKRVTEKALSCQGKVFMLPYLIWSPQVLSVPPTIYFSSFLFFSLLIYWDVDTSMWVLHIEFLFYLFWFNVFFFNFIIILGSCTVWFVGRMQVKRCFEVLLFVYLDVLEKGLLCILN